ncbi:hypothetical protein CspeluHIS016_0403820 [Cutaneotrichosporon spelunceum]|uniref:DUF28-domain-containing protein n=1 Tax=Cutaneotrichosporon spelunceum TaxID=1672016 RepID=A0AAD3YCV4_9TREE|nr:hypothetical protein CspeluHIS016_0403820 [Cutaneotrichosporon spelunceum]
MFRITQAGPSRLALRALSTSAPVASGHSRWSKIRHRKGAADAARSKAFSVYMAAVHVALRKGTDPDQNTDLAKALAAAKAAGVPKDNVERAFARARKIADGTGKSVTFEAVAAGGKVALMVECVTENPSRTAGRVKEMLSKGGARISPVGFMFERKGVVRLSPIEGQEDATFDNLFEAALEGGAEDVASVEGEDGMMWEIISGPTDLAALTTHLTSAPHDTLYELQTSELAYLANDPVPVTADGAGASVSEDKVETVMKAVTLLEEEGDVVRVWTNIDE